MLQRCFTGRDCCTPSPEVTVTQLPSLTCPAGSGSGSGSPPTPPAAAVADLGEELTLFLLLFLLLLQNHNQIYSKKKKKQNFKSQESNSSDLICNYIQPFKCRLQFFTRVLQRKPIIFTCKEHTRPPLFSTPAINLVHEYSYFCLMIRETSRAFCLHLAEPAARGRLLPPNDEGQKHIREGFLEQHQATVKC